jgi:hypothetical protein
MNRLLCVAAGLVLLVGGMARGDPPPGTKPIRVELHPAAAPSPALRYALLPSLREQNPGNAVPHYRTAIMTVKDAVKGLDDGRWYERIDRWRAMPLDQLPRDQVRRFLGPLDPGLGLVTDAARYEFVDWELTEKLRKTGFGTLLPDIQPMREFANYLALRSRLAMAEGRLDDAHRDLQTMFAVARDTGHAPILICDLVGIAVGSIAAERIDEFIQQPHAPNLYWALTDLPQPFVDVRMGMQGERLAVYGTFPNLPLTPAEASKVMTPEQVAMAIRLAEGLQRNDLDIPRPVIKVNLAFDLQRKHERAKQVLVATGWPADAVEKMPHIQVGLLHGFVDYERMLDEMMKCSNLPYWQAAPVLMEIDKKRRTYHGIPGSDQPAIALAEAAGPASGRVLYARTRLERKVAALRCLEALRLYAAGHDEKLPAHLDDIKEVPIPVDPFTGKPFDYEASGNRASLFAPAVALPIAGRKPSPQDALYYDIVMKP